MDEDEAGAIIERWVRTELEVNEEEPLLPGATERERAFFDDVEARRAAWGPVIEQALGTGFTKAHVRFGRSAGKDAAVRSVAQAQADLRGAPVYLLGPNGRERIDPHA